MKSHPDDVKGLLMVYEGECGSVIDTNFNQPRLHSSLKRTTQPTLAFLHLDDRYPLSHTPLQLL